MKTKEQLADELLLELIALQENIDSHNAYTNPTDDLLEQVCRDAKTLACMVLNDERKTG